MVGRLREWALNYRLSRRWLRPQIESIISAYSRLRAPSQATTLRVLDATSGSHFISLLGLIENPSGSVAQKIFEKISEYLENRANLRADKDDHSGVSALIDIIRFLKKVNGISKERAADYSWRVLDATSGSHFISLLGLIENPSGYVAQKIFEKISEYLENRANLRADKDDHSGVSALIDIIRFLKKVNGISKERAADYSCKLREMLAAIGSEHAVTETNTYEIPGEPGPSWWEGAYPRTVTNTYTYFVYDGRDCTAELIQLANDVGVTVRQMASGVRSGDESLENSLRPGK